MNAHANILIVHANPIMRENLGMALSAAGYGICSAATETEALRVLEQQPVDLILTSIVEWNWASQQFYGQVQGDMRWSRVAFLFLLAQPPDRPSGCASIPKREDCLADPIQPEDLLARVQRRLQRARLEHSGREGIVSQAVVHNWNEA